ncbi:MAG: hypothetical protein GC150_12610 [Rhizobiales bacterium]|nr:hypothetical protein [Hyphomicrobiales bacterium]
MPGTAYLPLAIGRTSAASDGPSLLARGVVAVCRLVLRHRTQSAGLRSFAVPLLLIVALLSSLSAKAGAPPPPASDWLAGERLAWSCISKGLEADLYAGRCVAPRRGSPPMIFRRALCDRTFDWLPHEPQVAARLRSSFLATIMTEATYREHVKPIGIRISNAVFCDRFDLENVHTDINLVLDKSYFHGPVGFQNFRTTKNLSIEAANIAQTLSLRRTRIEGSLFLSGSAIGSLVSQDLVVDSSLVARNAFVYLFATLARARITGRLDFGDAMLSHLTMKHATIGADVSLHGTQARCGATLVGNTIEGDLVIDGMRFSGREGDIFTWSLGKGDWPSWLTGLSPRERDRVEDFLRARMRDEGEGEWRYGDCRTRDGRPLFGYLKLNEQRVRGTLCLRNVYGDRSGAGAGDGWREAEPFRVMLNGVRSEGAIVLNWSERAGDGGFLRDGPNALWQMVGMETRSIVSELAAWPTTFQFHDVAFDRMIDGRSSCELEPEITGSTASGGLVMFRPPSDEALVSWLERNGIHSAQSYGQVVQVLRSIGRDATEIEVALAGLRLRELVEAAPRAIFPENGAIESARAAMGDFAATSLMADQAARYLWSWSKVQILRLYGVLIDFGHRPLKIVTWIIGTVILFVLILRWREAGKVYRVRTGQSESEYVRPGLFYAVDMFVPFIKLRDAHYGFELDDPLARYALYLYQLVGYLFSAFLLAGISGLTS